ncbi:hypothetical protein BDK92_7169 [Micromonospora pisi]|uniref:Uncharacterized protein n=2 Tax=Micromonospora pisi TaxID=589240 RepID=A0A495JV35_9ACTN|nr:hypothetical protein BDK92_7169 [Micromonospora pisi]
MDAIARLNDDVQQWAADRLRAGEFTDRMASMFDAAIGWRVERRDCCDRWGIDVDSAARTALRAELAEEKADMYGNGTLLILPDGHELYARHRSQGARALAAAEYRASMTAAPAPRRWSLTELAVSATSVAAYTTLVFLVGAASMLIALGYQP